MDILFRLMRKKEDGSFEVCGYEKHEYHGNTICICHVENLDNTVLFSSRINHSGAVKYIKHDRKDLYIGVEVDGVKVFERDEIKIPINSFHWDDDAPAEEDYECGTVSFKDGTFVLLRDDGSTIRMWYDGVNDWHSLENSIYEFTNFGKITGIHGVTPL